VCQSLGDLRLALGRYLACFESDLVTTAAAHGVVAEAAKLASLAEALLALAADRAADDRSFRSAGFRSPAAGLAQEVGIGAGQARQALELGRRLCRFEVVKEAITSGALCSGKARLVAEASEAAPAEEGRLVDLAKTASFAELSAECRRAVAKADRHPDRRRKRIHRDRSLSTWTALDGTFRLLAKGPTEDGATVLAALSPYRRFAFEEARRQGRRESEAAYSFDALVAMAEEALGRGKDQVASPPAPEAREQAGKRRFSGPGPAEGADAAEASARDSAGRPGEPAPGEPTSHPGPKRTGPPAKVIVRVDLEALRRGVVKGGEVSEITGLGPLAPAVVADLLAHADPFVAAVLTQGNDVVSVTHFGRRATATMRTALEWLHPVCAVAGCEASARLEVDHAKPWAETHHTRLCELRCLCRWHHDLKSNEGWNFVFGTNAFVPPSDPRHPRNRGPGADPEGP
jgi:hypothetical protein